MKFVVDAHLPPGLCEVLSRGGHDAIHTLHLPLQNKTPDRLLNALSLVEERVVVSKEPIFSIPTSYKAALGSCCWFGPAMRERVI